MPDSSLQKQHFRSARTQSEMPDFSGKIQISLLIQAEIRIDSAYPNN